MGRWGLWFWATLMTCFAVVSTAGAQALPLSAPSRTGHFEVELHARRTQASARAEQAAWLSLTVPFDALALPRASALARAQATRSQLEPREASGPAMAQPPSSAAVAAPSATAGASSALEPNVSEPTVSFGQLRTLTEFSERATRVALAVAGAAVDRRRVDALSARARASALLPELRLRAVRNTDQALRWVPSTDDPYRVTQADGAGLILEASATFRLDRLVFAHEELMVERLRLRAAAARLKLEGRVQQALIGLVRAHERACRDGVDDDTRLEQGLKALELVQELDVLTAGWFGEQAPSLGSALWGFPEAVLGACEAPDPPASAPAPAANRAANKPVATLGDSG